MKERDGINTRLSGDRRTVQDRAALRWTGKLKGEKELNQFAVSFIEEITGQSPEIEPMSTDFDTPLSLGIPVIIKQRSE